MRRKHEMRFIFIFDKPTKKTFSSKNVGNISKINIKNYAAHPHNMVHVHTLFKQHPRNVKNYTTRRQCMMHVPAQFRVNIAMRLRVTVRKWNVTDRLTDSGGAGGGVNTLQLHYCTPTLLYARITHFQRCTITQNSERISGQIRVFARILRFCPHTPFRPSPDFASDY